MKAIRFETCVYVEHGQNLFRVWLSSYVSVLAMERLVPGTAQWELVPKQDEVITLALRYYLENQGGK